MSEIDCRLYKHLTKELTEIEKEAYCSNYPTLCLDCFWNRNSMKFIKHCIFVYSHYVLKCKEQLEKYQIKLKKWIKTEKAFEVIE